MRFTRTIALGAALLGVVVFVEGTSVTLQRADAQETTPPGVQQVKPTDPLTTVLLSETVANGIATTPAGRVFLPFSRIDGSAGPQVVEWIDGKPVPFPDKAWNSWTKGDDPTKAFVRVNALRIGPLGSLWIVDVGAPGLDNAKLPHGPKLVNINLVNNSVVRIYDLDSVTNEKSFIDDIRFHDSTGYVTDAGSPGVIVIDLNTGSARRVLDGDPSVTAQRALTADEHTLHGPDGKPVKIHADQLEVSPDGKFFYYQPASGPMSRIATRYLDDPKLPTTQLAKHVTTFAKTPSTGGTAIDAEGNIYCSDVDKHRVMKIDPDGNEEVLIEDPRLTWVDAMWIDDKGYLFMPAAQLDRMSPFNDGVDKVRYPISIYKMKIGVKPPSSDHP